MYLLENIFFSISSWDDTNGDDSTRSSRFMEDYGGRNCAWRENIRLHLGPPRRHYYIFNTTSQHSNMPPEHNTAYNITVNIYLNHSMTLWLQEHNLGETGTHRLMKTKRIAASWLSQPVQGNNEICRARSQLLLLTLSPLSCLTRW